VDSCKVHASFFTAVFVKLMLRPYSMNLPRFCWIISGRTVDNCRIIWLFEEEKSITFSYIWGSHKYDVLATSFS